MSIDIFKCIGNNLTVAQRVVDRQSTTHIHIIFHCWSVFSAWASSLSSTFDNLSGQLGITLTENLLILIFETKVKIWNYVTSRLLNQKGTCQEKICWRDVYGNQSNLNQMRWRPLSFYKLALFFNLCKFLNIFHIALKSAFRRY